MVILTPVRGRPQSVPAVGDFSDRSTFSTDRCLRTAPSAPHGSQPMGSSPDDGVVGADCESRSYWMRKLVWPRPRTSFWNCNLRSLTNRSGWLLRISKFCTDSSGDGSRASPFTNGLFEEQTSPATSSVLGEVQAAPNSSPPLSGRRLALTLPRFSLIRNEFVARLKRPHAVVAKDNVLGRSLPSVILFTISDG